ncbi:MAG: YcbK family protein [Deltaproteobacteria bacterium]|nr:YcbK family protein [Deltaproteobacteria bacterium]
MGRLILIGILFSLIAQTSASAAAAPFFYSGNGKISLSSKAGVFQGAFRHADGTYDQKALARITTVLGGNWKKPESSIELRFIEFLDYLQDTFHTQKITITSGYRSPNHNQHLRKQGKLAGKASLHQYGMAADVEFVGTSSKRVWEHVRKLGIGGVGFYHGAKVHIDVGPARYWDETTSGVGTNAADDNKLILLFTDRDIYSAGDTITTRFARMTAWPIGVDTEWMLEKEVKQEWKKVKQVGEKSHCKLFSSILDMTSLPVTLPSDLEPGKYRLIATFCARSQSSMPESISSHLFEIRP